MSIGHFLIIYSKLGIQVFWSTQRNSIIEQYKWTNFSDNGEVYTLHSRQYWFLKNSSPCKRHSSDQLVNYFLKKSVEKKSYFNVKSLSLRYHQSVQTFSQRSKKFIWNLLYSFLIRSYSSAQMWDLLQLINTWWIDFIWLAFWFFFGWSSAIFLTKFSQSPFYYSKEISLKIERCE